MKKLITKMFSLSMVMAILFHTVSPMVVYAVAYEDGNEITISGSSGMNGSKLAYEHGDVEIKKNGETIESETFSVSKDDQIIITLYSDENYTGKLHLGNHDVTLDNGSYSFTIGNDTDSELIFTPSFESEEQTHVVTFDFRLNGKDFTDIGNNETITVSDDFDFENINEFYIKNIYIDGNKTYSYANNEYSYDLLDSEGRHIFEINTSKTSNNFIKIRIQSHPSDILTSDLKQDRSNYYEFYIPEISLKKSSFRGVEVTTNVMPDNYDFTTWNGVDLSDTSINNPGEVTVYYGEDTINFLNDNIKTISLVEGKDVPLNAVVIDSEAGSIEVLSNYYNKIPLKIELNDGTVGYVNVNRIGIFISSLNKGNTVFYHGASADVGENMNVDTDKNRIAAVFYHENTKTGSEYELIVNLTYEDGTTETKIAEFVGDVNNSTGNLIGSDYILWKGNENMPVKVSAIAVEKDALTETDSFGGATFGSGEGVTWERN